MKNLLWLVLLASLKVSAGVTCIPSAIPPLHVAAGLIPAGVSINNTYWAAWVCSTPSGYITEAYIGNLGQEAVNIVEYFEGLYTTAMADCTASCASYSQLMGTEQAFMSTTLQQYRPLAQVAFNGASTTRSVYGLNADGTLNPTPVANESVAVATRCDEKTRIVTAPTYYSVAGANDQNGKPLPVGTYAICVVSLPIGSN